MTAKNKDLVIWTTSSKKNVEYHLTTWFRCAGIEEFIKKVNKTHIIMGITFSGNNLGFIVEEKTKNGTKKD